MKKLIFSVMMILVVFVPFVALALPVGTATLTWDPPTTNVDGTDLTDLSGYKLYYGTGSGSYAVTIDIPCGILPCPGFSTDPPTDLERQEKAVTHPTIIAVSGLEDNMSWYFAATAYDTFANESGYSNEVSKFIPSSVVDTDGDGMTDVWENYYGLNPNSASDASQDADGDGLTNLQEFGYNTDPKKIDTDGDGRSDKQEVLVGTDPLSSTSFKSVKNDFDGDGKADKVIFRPSNGMWCIVDSSTGRAHCDGPWGMIGDIPVANDYDNDGTTDKAIWRPSNGYWGIINSKDGSVRWVQWGSLGDVPVSNDFDGDGKADTTIWRPSNGAWCIIYTSTGQASCATQWGTVGDIP